MGEATIPGLTALESGLSLHPEEFRAVGCTLGPLFSEMPHMYGLRTAKDYCNLFVCTNISALQSQRLDSRLANSASKRECTYLRTKRTPKLGNHIPYTTIILIILCEP